MLKKAISFLLTACMLASFAVCGQAETDLTAAMGSWAEPYPETVVLTTATSEHASAVYPEGDDVTNNAWTRAYKDRFNVELQTKWVSDDYETRINLAITSNDLPDVFQ